jgi:uncharacterized membrane protein
MRNAIAAAFGIALVGIWGCGESTKPPGGPGANRPPSEQSSVGMTPDTFKLTLPSMSTHVKQGESKTASISISRGKSFTQDVRLSFENLPPGVTIEPTTTTIKPGDSSVTVTIRASDTAEPGDHAVRVIGHPTSGPDSNGDMKITVTKK